MKNTAYKDIFNFGEEALSINDKFSNTTFPTMKNAFTIGENIREMKNVSPLATVKFFNQSTEYVLAKYYPDAQAITSSNNNLVLDESIKKSGYDFYKYEFFSDKNRNGSVEKNEELIFKLLLFVSTDGNKVKECYEVIKPADDEIIFFLETDDDTLSDDVLFGRTSEKIKKLYTDHSSGKLYKTFFDGDILNKIKKHAGNINQEIIEELFLKGYIEKKGIKQGFFTFLKYTLMGISAPAKALGWVLNKLGNGIDFLKISDEVWDTENDAYYFQKDKLIENLTISSDKLKSLKDFFTDKKDIDVVGSDILKVVLDNIILQQITTIEAFIETYNNYVKEEIEEIFKTLEDLPPSDSPSLSERIALICGIWNGLIDFVSSIFKFFGSLLEAPFDISKNFQQTLEMIDTFWKMLRDGTLYKNMKSSINYGMTQIVQYLKKNSDDINWVRVYYIGGFSLAFLGTFFIPLANVAKIANAGKLGEILAKINSEVGKTISQTAKFVKVNSIQAYQKVSRALIDLLEIFNVGGQKLKKFVDDLWKKIAEWFVKNKKLLLYEGPGSEIRSALAKVVDITSDLAPIEILEYEKKIFDFADEWAGIKKATGEMIENISNNKSREVDLSKYAKELSGAIVTHNHPKGNSLSTGDIRRFLMHEMQEIRAIAKTDKSVFVLRYTGKSLTFKEIAAIQKEIAIILRPKNIPIDFNSLDVADLWIKKLLEHFPDRIEYIHYKKI